MGRPTTVTNLDGLLIEPKAFIEPHKKWFDRAIEKTGDKSLEKWKGKKDYFKGVDIAMKKIMPNASPEKRTKKARQWYQQGVIKYIQEHPKVIIKANVKRLKEMKENCRLVLLTTNTKDYINKILEVSNLQDIYDDIIASETEKEPNKERLIKKLIKKYEKPKFYISGKIDEEFFELLRERNITIILGIGVTEREKNKIN